MKRKISSVWITIAILVVGAGGCGSSESDSGEAEVPAMLRIQFQTQMKTILHDVKVAEEMAAAYEGSYKSLEELRGSYLNRVVPDNYELTISDVTPSGYRAEVVHKASGLRCRLVVTAEPGGQGSPTCD